MLQNLLAFLDYGALGFAAVTLYLTYRLLRSVIEQRSQGSLDATDYRQVQFFFAASMLLFAASLFAEVRGRGELEIFSSPASWPADIPTASLSHGDHTVVLGPAARLQVDATRAVSISMDELVRHVTDLRRIAADSFGSSHDDLGFAEEGGF